jgi:hypothetical protein
MLATESESALRSPGEQVSSSIRYVNGKHTAGSKKGDMRGNHFALALSFSIPLLIVTGTGTLFDKLLIREGIPRLDLLLFSNLLTGIVAGFISVQSRIRELDKQQLTRERLAKIAEMNHHIRNALQVVTFYAASPENSKAVGTIKDAIHRIEWTLEEVLTKGWDIQGELPTSVTASDSDLHRSGRRNQHQLASTAQENKNRNSA